MFTLIRLVCHIFLSIKELVYFKILVFKTKVIFRGYSLMLILCWLLHCLLLLLSVAFFTLFERKVMGLFHNRLGPNKVSFVGLLQPLLDAFKLLTKQSIVPLRANKFTYHASPHVALVLALFI